MHNMHALLRLEARNI